MPKPEQTNKSIAIYLRERTVDRELPVGRRESPELVSNRFECSRRRSTHRMLSRSLVNRFRFVWEAEGKLCLRRPLPSMLAEQAELPDIYYEIC